MKKKVQQEKKRRPKEYIEDREARENFEKAMKSLFRSPKKSPKGKD